MRKHQKQPTVNDYWDAQAVAHELADAAEAYVKFFEATAESPRLNAARHRLQKAIREVRGS